MGPGAGYKPRSRRPRTVQGAPVAQLDRASDFESESRPFESGRAYRADAEFDKQVVKRGPLAQLVEQWTLNPLAEGSSPSWPTANQLSFRSPRRSGRLDRCRG